MKAEQQTYHCKKCDRAFTTERAINMHKRLAHTTAGREATLRGAATRSQTAITRRETKRNGEAHRSAAPSLPAVKFCPNCGCNIHAVGVALSI